MEVCRREAFAAATELPHLRLPGCLPKAEPALSGLIRSLGRDGTRVLFRITRQVKLTNAGSELLAHAKIILDDFAAAAVRAIALREDGTAQAGITRQEMPTQPSFIPVPGQAATIGAATIEVS